MSMQLRMAVFVEMNLCLRNEKTSFYSFAAFCIRIAGFVQEGRFEQETTGCGKLTAFTKCPQHDSTSRGLNLYTLILKLEASIAVSVSAHVMAISIAHPADETQLTRTRSTCLLGPSQSPQS